MELTKLLRFLNIVDIVVRLVSGILGRREAPSIEVDVKSAEDKKDAA